MPVDPAPDLCDNRRAVKSSTAPGCMYVRISLVSMREREVDEGSDQDYHRAIDSRLREWEAEGRVGTSVERPSLKHEPTGRGAGASKPNIQVLQR